MGATEASKGASIQPCTHGSSQGREVQDPHQLLRGHRLLLGLLGAPGGLLKAPVASTPVPHPAAPCQPVPRGARPAAAPKHTQTSHPALSLCSVASSLPLRWVEDGPRPHLRLPPQTPPWFEPCSTHSVLPGPSTAPERCRGPGRVPGLWAAGTSWSPWSVRAHRTPTLQRMLAESRVLACLCPQPPAHPKSDL